MWFKSFLTSLFFMILTATFISVLPGLCDTLSPPWRPNGDFAGTGYMRAVWTTIDEGRGADIYLYDQDSGFPIPPEINSDCVDWKFDIIIESFAISNSYKKARLQITYEGPDGAETYIQSMSLDGRWEKVGRFEAGYGFYTDVYDFSWMPETDSDIITIAWTDVSDKPSDPSNYLDQVLLEILCTPLIKDASNESASSPFSNMGDDPEYNF